MQLTQMGAIYRLSDFQDVTFDSYFSGYLRWHPLGVS
jgi:hypothetical protein